jgi:tetratricopeptide (TPR) repeat protein
VTPEDRARFVRFTTTSIGIAFIATVVLSPLGIWLIRWGRRRANEILTEAEAVVGEDRITALDDVGDPFLYEWGIPSAFRIRRERGNLEYNVPLTKSSSITSPQPPTPRMPAQLKAPASAPDFEKAYVQGVKLLLQSEVREALSKFEQSHSDGYPGVISPALLAGVLAATVEGRESDAIRYLETVLASDLPLPDQLMKKYWNSAFLRMKVTSDLWGEVPLDAIGAAVTLGLLYGGGEELEKGITILESALERFGHHTLAAAVLADFLGSAERWEDLIKLTDGIRNDDDASCQALIFRARALQKQGLHGIALEVLNEALRSQERHQDILKAALYRRGLVYESRGEPTEARKDFERVYARDSSYADVATRVAQGA